MTELSTALTTGNIAHSYAVLTQYRDGTVGYVDFYGIKHAQGTFDDKKIYTRVIHSMYLIDLGKGKIIDHFINA